MVTLRSWGKGGTLTGEVTVEGGKLRPGGKGEMARVVSDRARLLGSTLEEAVADLDGWSNGYVAYTTSAEPVEAWG